MTGIDRVVFPGAFKQFMLSLAGLVMFLSGGYADAKPMVLASIKPLTLIAQEIAGNAAVTDTLLPVTASPHDYPLKVSDYGRLQKADVILWIGPELESFLQKPITNLQANKAITAYDLNGLYWPEEQHDETVESGHHHERDPHLWLDPRNAVVIAVAVAGKLQQIDPANAKIYNKNLQDFTARMQQLDASLLKALKPLAGHGFAVYHEGYGHFVSHYGLRQIDFVTFTPEQRPGAKHLYQLRQAMAHGGECLFMEPYFESQSMRDLAQELKLRLGTLDALGTQNAPSYAQLLQQMADAFLACLTNGSVH